MQILAIRLLLKAHCSFLKNEVSQKRATFLATYYIGNVSTYSPISKQFVVGIFGFQK
jgi:hypothetical protein